MVIVPAPASKTKTKNREARSDNGNGADSGRVSVNVGEPERGKTRGIVAMHRGAEIHCDRIDVLAAKQRRKFIRDVAAKLELTEADLSYLDGDILEAVKIANAQAVETQHSSIESVKSTGSIADSIRQLVKGVELFHTQDKQAFARIPVILQDEESIDHHEVYAVGGRAFRSWLRQQSYERLGMTPQSQQIEQVIESLACEAEFCGPCHEVYLRVSEKHGVIHLDLGGPDWRVVKIDKKGWEIVPPTSVRFRRTPTMAALPRPERGGSIELLRRFLNFREESDFILTVGTIVGMFQSSGACPLLAIHGPEDSAKSTATRVIKRCIDPETRSLLNQPTKAEDIAVSSCHRWVLAYDNLSSLSKQLSDAFCTLSTGGNRSEREMYTNSGEALIGEQRPAIINGITEVVSRRDLMSRQISLYLPALNPQIRKTERKFWTEFEQALPKLLGVLLDGVSAGLKNREQLLKEQRNNPRLMDFSVLAMGAMPAFGWKPADFLRVMHENQNRADCVALEASPIYEPLMWYLRKNEQRWKGTATELLAELGECFGQVKNKPPGWPREPSQLSNELRRIERSLASVESLSLDFPRASDHKRTRLIEIRGNKKAS